LNEPIPLFIAAFVMILVGFVFSYLSVKWLGWFVIILGIVNIASLLVADIALLTAPDFAGSWDAIFGNYAAINGTIPAGPALDAFTMLNPAALGPALIVTVGMMWPYLIMPVAGEVSQPSKNIPLSNVGGWAGIAAMFLLSGFALESAMGSFLYQANSAFNIGLTFFPGFGNYAAVVLGASPLAWFAIMGPIIASVLDSPSNALWVTRPMHSMAMDRFCPEAFARVHPKYHVPHITLYFWLILATLTLVYATVLQLVYNTALGALIGVAFTYVFIRWQMALAAVSLPYYRPTLWERSGGWKFLGIPLIAIGGLISGAIFFYAMIAFVPSAQHEILFTVLVYVIGQIAYMYYGSKNKAKGIEMSAIFGQLPPE